MPFLTATARSNRQANASDSAAACLISVSKPAQSASWSKNDTMKKVEDDTRVNVNVTLRDGQIQNVQARLSDPLMYALSEQNTGVEAVCGGCLSCATCHVYIDAKAGAALPPPEDEEIELISGLLNAQPNSRLSCQIKVTGELQKMAITIAPPES